MEKGREQIHVLKQALDISTLHIVRNWAKQEGIEGDVLAHIMAMLTCENLLGMMRLARVQVFNPLTTSYKRYLVRKHYA